jgi:hypothetical protein
MKTEIKKYPKPFTAGMFTPTEHSTAEDKARFANHYVRFVLSGFNRNLFYSWFYRRLSMTFGHIAHYNAHGFWDTWFGDPFLHKQFIAYHMDAKVYGDPKYTYSDVERAIQKWLKAHSGCGCEADVLNAASTEKKKP